MYLRTLSIITIILLFFSSHPLTAQIEQHEVTVLNISVPVRVYSDGKFVPDLKLEDFEILQDGIPQTVKALYLAQKDKIIRQEEYKEFSPQTSRHFILLFQIMDYNPKLAEAMDYLFENVLLPKDRLTVMTSVQIYNLNPKVLNSKPRKQLSKELQGLIRKDTQVGSSTYRNLVKDLRRLVRSMTSSANFSQSMTGVDEESSTDTGFSLEFLLPRYRETLQKMESLRVGDPKQFLVFAERLKQEEGQKNVFFIYQREFRPEIQPRIITQMMTMYQDKPNIQGDLQDLMNFYSRLPRMDLDSLSKAFSDAGIYFNFIFMNKEPEHISGIHMQEQSEDIFSTMSAIAKGTGGVVDNSQNPFVAFKNGCEKAESYYIIYFTPKNYITDGKFKTLQINLNRNDRKYQVIHRQGYYAR